MIFAFLSILYKDERKYLSLSVNFFRWKKFDIGKMAATYILFTSRRANEHRFIRQFVLP